MHSRLLLALFAVLLLAGCASRPDERIRQSSQTFSQLPPDVQQRIRAGQIDLGYTEEMVWMALGEPARRVERVDLDGRTQVWVYSRTQSQPRFSFGIGMGNYGRHSAVGTSVGVSTGGGYYEDEAMRVEFLHGRVVRVDYRRG